MSTLGKRIYTLRLQRGMTQSEVAKPLVSHAYLSLIESGHRMPTGRVLEHIADKLGVTVDELETGRPPGIENRLGLELGEARRLLSQGLFDESRDHLAKTKKEAARWNLPVLVSRTVSGMGMVEERLGRAEEAMEFYQEAERLLLGHPLSLRVDAITGQARCAQLQGDLRYALHLLESAIDRLEKDGKADPASKARLLAPAILIYYERGLFKQAAELADEVIDLIPRIKDPLSLAIAHVNVARSHLQDRDFRSADLALIRAEELFTQLDLATELGRAKLARGYVLARQEKKKAALSELEEALEIFTEADASVDRARALTELGRLHRLGGSIDKARDAMTEAAGLLVGEQHVSQLAEANLELGAIEASNPPTAEKHIRQAIELFDRAEQPVQVALGWLALGELWGQSKSEKKACDAYRSGLTALKTLTEV